MASAAADGFVPAPEGGEEAKLMVVGGGVCCNRNKIPSIPYDGDSCYKPAGLSNLSNELFDNFIRDIQLSMKARFSLFWPILTTIFVLFVVVPMFVPAEHFTLYGVACLFALGILARLRYNHQADFKCEMEARLDEWQPLFVREGFVVEYVVDRKWWTSPESYLYFHRRSVGANQVAAPAASGAKFSPLYEEEAKYLLLFARLFLHRNKTFRVMPLSREATHWHCTKPPALYNLNDDVFMKLMQDMDGCMRSFVIKKRNVTLGLVALWILINFLSAGNAVVVMPFLVLFLALEEVVLPHLLHASTLRTKLEQEWHPLLASYGFTVEYRVDRPHWYSWPEGYMHIRRLGSFSASSVQRSSSREVAL